MIRSSRHVLLLTLGLTQAFATCDIYACIDTGYCSPNAGTCEPYKQLGDHCNSVQICDLDANLSCEDNVCVEATDRAPIRFPGHVYYKLQAVKPRMTCSHTKDCDGKGFCSVNRGVCMLWKPKYTYCNKMQQCGPGLECSEYTCRPVNHPEDDDCHIGGGSGLKDDGLYSPGFPGILRLDQADPNMPAAFFPSLPGIPLALNQTYLPGTEGQTVDPVMLAARQAEAGLYMQGILSPITIGGETLPAAFFRERDLTFESVDQFAKMAFPIDVLAAAGENPKLAARLDLAQQVFTDTVLLEDNFWTIISSQNAFNPAFSLRRVKAADVEGLAMIFAEVMGLDITTDMYTFDTRSIALTPPSSPEGAPEANFAVGALTVLRFEEREGERRLIPLAIEVSMPKDLPDRGVVKQVHAPSLSSDSAWRLAMLGGLISFGQTGPINNHMGPWHLATGAFQMALYNNLAPDHALRTILDPFSRFNMQWVNLVFFNQVSLGAFPYVGNQEAFLTQWHDFNHKVPFVDQIPSRYFEQHGISVDDFSSPGTSDWANLPSAQWITLVEPVVDAFLERTLKVTYKQDCDVTGDTQLQRFYQDLLDPSKGNLGAKVTPSGHLETLEDLHDLVRPYLYSIIAHGSARIGPLIDFYGPISPLSGGSFRTRELVTRPREEEYTLQQILANMPSTRQAWDYASFQYFFTQAAPYVPLFSEDGVEADLPYGDSPRTPYNRAFVQFRRELDSAYDHAVQDEIDLGNKYQELHEQMPLSTESRRL